MRKFTRVKSIGYDQGYAVDELSKLVINAAAALGTQVDNYTGNVVRGSILSELAVRLSKEGK